MRKFIGAVAALILVLSVAGGCQRRESTTATEASATPAPTVPPEGASTSTSTAPLETTPTRVP